MPLERENRWHRENDLEEEKQRLHERQSKSFLELGMARSEADKSVHVVDESYTEGELSPATGKSNPEGGKSQPQDDMPGRGKSTPVADADTSLLAAGRSPPAADTPHSADDTQQAEEPHNRRHLPRPQ